MNRITRCLMKRLEGLLTVCLMALPIAASAAIPSIERDALVSLYNSTDGANWNDRTNWLGAAGTECTWYGVVCDVGETTVLELDLYVNNLVGTIPLKFYNLTNLVIINFNNNSISGPIPSQLGDLTNLTQLSLNRNKFTGSIPPELAKLDQLWNLDLSYNPLSGSIPAEIGKMTSLQRIYLINNQLTGEIPAELSDLSNLQYLWLQGNQLSGSIPSWLGNLSNMLSLNLYDNQFTGGIPLELGNLSSLRNLDLSINKLTGTIPVELGNLTLLRTLYLDDNRLTGPIPSELENLSVLERIRLSGNQLSGVIPSSLINLTALISNNLRFNALHSEDSALLSFLNATSSIDLTLSQTVDATGVTVDNIGEDSADLTWDSVTYTQAGGYYIYLATNISGPFSKITTVSDKATTTATITGLSSGTTYYVQVRSYTEPHADNSNLVVSDGELGSVSFTTTSPSPAPAPAPGPEPEAAPAGGSSGGCSINIASGFDPLLPLLMLLSAVSLLRRRQQTH